MVEFQQNVIFPAIFLHAECSSTIPSLSKSAAAIRTCGEHPNGITINYVTVSSICNRARCVIGSRRAAVGGRARRRTQLWRTFESVQKVILHTLVCQIDVHARLLILGVKVPPTWAYLDLQVYFKEFFPPTCLFHPTGLLILRNFSNIHVYSTLQVY